METSRAVGVILAGGRSSRMGSDKAFVELDGVPMFRWVETALRAADCEVVVAGRDHLGELPSYADPPGAPVGPLGGLFAVARQAGSSPIVLVATDHPLLRAETVSALLDHDDPIVAPIDDDVAQVTCAVYRPSQFGRGPLELARSIQDLITQVPTRHIQPAEWNEWGEDGRSWFSVDTPEALSTAASWPDS